MKYSEALKMLSDTYTKKYNFPEANIDKMMKNGIEEYGLSVLAVYNGARMTLGTMFNEQEYFSSDDVAAMLNCSVDEANQEIEAMIDRLKAEGQDPSKYITKSKAIGTFFFPNGFKK